MQGDVMRGETKNKNLLLMSTFITGTGNVLFAFAINWWIMNKSANPLILGTVNAAIFVPKIIFNLLGGSLSDMGNRKYILLVCDLFCGILILFFYLYSVISGFNIGMVILINIMLSVFQTIYNPATRAIVTDLFCAQNIILLNSKITIINQIVKVVAPIFGGILLNIEFIGVEGLFLINSLSFFITSFIDFLLVYNSTNITKKKKEFIQNLIDVLKIFKKKENHSMLLLMSYISISNFFVAGYELSLPVLGTSYDGCGLSINCYSLFLVMGAIGCFIGAKLAMHISIEKMCLTDVFKSTLGMFFPLLLLALTKNIALLCISIMIYSILETIFNVLFFSYIQVNADRNYIGRIISSVYIFAGILVPIANILFGYVLTLSYNICILLISISLFLLNILFVVFSSRISKL